MSLIWGQGMNRSMHPPASIFVLQRSPDGGQSGAVSGWSHNTLTSRLYPWNCPLLGGRGRAYVPRRGSRWGASNCLGSAQLAGTSSPWSPMTVSYTNPTCLPADGSLRQWSCVDSQLMEHRELQRVMMSQSTLGTSPEWEFRTVSLKMKQ